VRYKADPALAGCALGVRASTNFFGQTILADPAICDGEWHTVTGVWGMHGRQRRRRRLPLHRDEPPDRRRRRDRVRRLPHHAPRNVWREIDNSCPVAFMRADWGIGIREVFTFPTQVHTARDGSEHRTSAARAPPGGSST
jgi:hypothetical protein